MGTEPCRPLDIFASALIDGLCGSELRARPSLQPAAASCVTRPEADGATWMASTAVLLHIAYCGQQSFQRERVRASETYSRKRDERDR